MGTGSKPFASLNASRMAAPALSLSVRKRFPDGDGVDIVKETIDTFNTGESRGREVSHSLNYQKLGKELMSQDELLRLSTFSAAMLVENGTSVQPFSVCRVTDLTLTAPVERLTMRTLDAA